MNVPGWDEVSGSMRTYMIWCSYFVPCRTALSCPALPLLKCLFHIILLPSHFVGGVFFSFFRTARCRLYAIHVFSMFRRREVLFSVCVYI